MEAILLLASDYSTSYAIGRLSAIVVLAVLTFALVRRAVRRRRAEAAFTPSPAVAPVTDTSASVGPPGSPAAPPLPPARPARAGRSRTGWRSDALAAAVFGALLVAALVQLAGRQLGGDGPWDTAQGRELHAGFVVGCQQGNGGVIDCECVFEHLTSASPFDTPEGFANLGRTIERTMPVAVRSGDVNALPAPVVDALRACVA